MPLSGTQAAAPGGIEICRLRSPFTFTTGAMLFERLSMWASGRGGSARWKKAGLTSRDLQRARFRCLEEVESVRYSIQDLEYAGWHLKWLTGSGQRLSSSWQKRSSRLNTSLHPKRKAVLASNSPSPPTSYQGTPPSPPNLRPVRLGRCDRRVFIVRCVSHGDCGIMTPMKGNVLKVNKPAFVNKEGLFF